MESGVAPKPKQVFYAIQDGDRYYIAVAVLEYDPKAVGTNQEKIDGVKKVKEMFEKAVSLQPLSATNVTAEFSEFGPLNTNPFAV